MAFDDSRVLLRDLLLETKDGEWGKDQPSGDSMEMLVIRGTDFPHVRAGDLSSSPTRHINRKNGLRKTLQAGDILIETAGGSKGRPTGRTIYISKEILSKSSLPVTCASFARFLRVDPNLALPEYVFWFLQALYASGAIEKHQVQHSGIARFQYTKFASEVEILLPPRSEQMDISGTLSALDDKITMLRETNATLEAIARALFKSWFVDFAPVRAKAEGRDPEGLPPEVADLFPKDFEDSEFGEIPKGWSTIQVKELCSSIFNGGTPSRANPSFWEAGTIDWFKTGELADGFLLSSSERIADVGLKGSAARLLPRHSVLMAIYAAPTVGRLGILSKPATFNQACTGLVPKPEIGPWFLFQSLFAGRAWFNNRANGAAQQNISKVIVESYPTIMPSSKLLSVFNDNVDGIYQSIEHNARSISTISDLRDTLLPRLVSGKLRIPDAREITA